MSDEVVLKKCPFCGSDRVSVGWFLRDIAGVQEEDWGVGADGPELAMYSVACANCQFESDDYHSAQTIADLWNARA